MSLFLGELAKLFNAAALVLLGLIAIAGLILLIIGILNRRKPKFGGKGSPAVCIAFGSVLLVICAVILLLWGFSFSAANGLIEKADGLMEKFMGPEYDNVIDEWRNEWTTDTEAAFEAKTALLAAADSGDREGVAQLFTPELRKRLTFDATLDDFLALYPVGLSECELDGGLSMSESFCHEGERVRTGSAYYTTELDGEWYAIRLRFCYENSEDPDKVGVTFFAIEDLEANALGEDYGYYDYLLCRFADESDVTARLIDGRGFIFEPYNREITEESFKNHLNGCATLQDLIDRIGRPNVKKKYDNCTGFDIYYELVPENGEPRYAYLSVDDLSGKIYSAYICSDKETLYDRKLYDKDK